MHYNRNRVHKQILLHIDLHFCSNLLPISVTFNLVQTVRLNRKTGCEPELSKLMQ